MRIRNKVVRFLKKNCPLILSVTFKDEEGNHKVYMEGGFICWDMDTEIPFKLPHSPLFYKFLKASKKIGKKKT